MTYVKLSLYILGLVGSAGVWLPILNIQREFFEDHSIYFMISLWGALIGLLVIKKYENHKTEKEMLNR